MGVQTPVVTGNFEGKGWPTVKYRDYRPCAAVVQPFLPNYFDHLLLN